MFINKDKPEHVLLALLACLGVYLFVFMYLQISSFPDYRQTKSFDTYSELVQEDVELTANNIDSENFAGGAVSSVSRLSNWYPACELQQSRQRLIREILHDRNWVEVEFCPDVSHVHHIDVLNAFSLSFARSSRSASLISVASSIEISSSFCSTSSDADDNNAFSNTSAMISLLFLIFLVPA